MISTFHREFLKGPLALWLGSANKNNFPDAIRCTGVTVEDDHTLRIFFTEKFSEKFRRNILENPNMTLLASNLYNFDGFQYKGKFIGQITPGTEEEMETQKFYMDVVGDIFQGFGMDKQKSIDMYYYEPTFAVLMKVEHIYDQAPKKNTGGEVHR